MFLQVLPALREHRDEVLLRELLNRWNNHKVMVRWLSRFFNYLDRYVQLTPDVLQTYCRGSSSAVAVLQL
jgi:hypothetical protein